jgi:uncharacterized protein
MAAMDEPAPKRRPVAWRNQLRSLHRDLGFLAVGLTVIYAVSGIAVNHIDDWTGGDPSYSNYRRLHVIEQPLPEDDDRAVTTVLEALQLAEPPRDVFTQRRALVRYEFEHRGERILVKPDVNEITVTRPDGEQTVELGDALPEDGWAAVQEVLRRLGREGEPERHPERIDYALRDIELTWENRTLRVEDHGTGAHVIEEGRRPRFFLHVANWLHLNRGKQAWTYFADAYAVVLLLLASTGMIMVRGRQGVFGRGGVFLLIGIAVPVLYVVLSGP